MKKYLFYGLFFLLPMAAALAPQASAAKGPGTQASEASAGAVKVTFVELGSVNCMPCRMMQPVIKEIEEEYAGEVEVIFYDVWTKEGRPFGQKYKINAIPTQVFLDKDGKEYFRHMGYFPKEDIIKILQKQGVTPRAKNTAPNKKSGSEAK